MDKKKCTFKKGGFDKIDGNVKAANKGRLDKLKRPPRTAKEHEQWRQKQKKTFVLWRSFLDDEE